MYNRMPSLFVRNAENRRDDYKCFSFRFGITNCMNVDISHDEHMINDVNVFSQVSLSKINKSKQIINVYTMLNPSTSEPSHVIICNACIFHAYF